MRSWTRKAVAWVTGCIIILSLGLWRSDYQVMAVGMAMTLFLLVAYARRTPTVMVRRKPSHLRVLEGDHHEMGFNVGARDGWADVVELHDTIPGYMDLAEGSNHLVLPLYKGEMRRASYSLVCPLRGAYRLGPLEVRTSDAMDCFEQQDMIPGTHELDVVPLYVELRNLDLQSRALKYNMGPVTINELGRSTDFYSIREYVRGDPYRKINWKASAKRRQLMINEDEKETLSDIAIFVDSRTVAALGTPLDNFHESALRSTLGLSRTLVASKNRVMVTTYNDSVNIVPPGLGNAHNRVVQAMIIETVARGNLTFDWAAGYARPFLKPRSDIVVFSPLVSDMTFYPAILGMIRSGLRVVIVTAALEEYEERATGQQRSRALLMGMQRTTNIAELEAAGVQVIEVDPDEPQLSMLVRVSAALGGERLDVAALEGEEAEDLPEFQDIPKVPGRRHISQELQEEVLGVRTGMPWLMALQAMALAALVVTCIMAWYLAEDVWDAINTDIWGPMMDTPTYLLLVSTGMIMGWALAMLLGFIKHRRERQPRSNLVYLAYAAIFLLIVWHAGSVLLNLDRGGSPQVLIWDMVLLPPMLGSLAVFRRSISYAAFAVAILLVFGLVDANLMDDVTRCMVMGLAVAAFLELTWAHVRFDRIYELGGLGLPKNRGRPRALFDATMVRYMVVFTSVLMVSGILLVVISILPSWFASDPTPGVPSPIDADTVMAPFYLLLWLVVLTVAGRWAVIAFMGSRKGHRTIDWVREHMLIPRRLRRRPSRKGPSEEDVREPDDGTTVVWEEETPPPEVPVPHG